MKMAYAVQIRKIDAEGSTLEVACPTNNERSANMRFEHAKTDPEAMHVKLVHVQTNATLREWRRVS